MGFIPSGGGPNVIANKEDGAVINSKGDQLMKNEYDPKDPANFRQIQPQRTNAQLLANMSRRTKSKERPTIE